MLDSAVFVITQKRKGFKVDKGFYKVACSKRDVVFCEYSGEKIFKFSLATLDCHLESRHEPQLKKYIWKRLLHFKPYQHIQMTRLLSDAVRNSDS